MHRAGRVDDALLHALYEAADVFVHATRYEGSSLVTLEAMAHARCVVATRAGGIPDKVVPGATGWLVDPGDISALAGRPPRKRPRSGPPRRVTGKAGLRAASASASSGRSSPERTIALYEELLLERPA